MTGPAEEMQHDTSLYTIVIAGKKVKRQCASLVLGYSRMLYMDFHLGLKNQMSPATVYNGS